MRGIDGKTAFFSVLPGGLSEMGNIGATVGARMEPIALLQALRVAIVVLLIPPLMVAHGLYQEPLPVPDLEPELIALALAASLGGALLTYVARFNNPWMIGALIGTGLLTAFDLTNGKMPHLLFAVGQVLIGYNIGTRFKRGALKKLPRVAVVGIVIILAMVAVMALYALGLAQVVPLDLAVAILSSSPGGTAEMATTAQNSPFADCADHGLSHHPRGAGQWLCHLLLAWPVGDRIPAGAGAILGASVCRAIGGIQDHEGHVDIRKTPAASLLASFAANLRFEDIPAVAVERATHCVIDAVACALFGARFPWCKMVLDQTSLDQDGPFLAISPGGGKGAIREAALAWGTQSHAFELDSLCRPSAGVHPGATVALPALAMAQARGSSGRDLITAIVAGCEVMFRIGTSTLHSPEKRGFHAPGLNGPFGAAIACGSLMGLSAAELGNALGIAGSLGVRAAGFQQGAARRHGETACIWAARPKAACWPHNWRRTGSTGLIRSWMASLAFSKPYCDHSDPSLLTADIGTQWKIQSLCLKPFACHITAHTPAQLLRDLMREHGFGGGEIAALRLGVSDKVLSHHTSRNPADVMQAQYSVPYVTAIAAYRDPSDPNSFSEDALADAAVRNLAERVELRPKRSGSDGWGVEMSVTLRDGRIVEGALDSFIGCPDAPFSVDRLRGKFMALTEGRQMDRDALFRKLETILSLDDVGALWP